MHCALNWIVFQKQYLGHIVFLPMMQWYSRWESRLFREEAPPACPSLPVDETLAGMAIKLIEWKPPLHGTEWAAVLACTIHVTVHILFLSSSHEIWEFPISIIPQEVAISVSANTQELQHAQGCVLLYDLGDNASSHGLVSLSEGESLVHLQRNVVFECQCQRCVISWHHHLLVWREEADNKNQVAFHC